MNEIQKSYLLETAKWQKVIGILMAIGTGFIALAAILFIGLGAFAPDTIASADKPAAYFIIMGIIYIPLTVLYFFMTRYMLRSAKYLKAWCASDAEEDLTEGLKNNKSYFKFSGILAIVGIGLGVLLLICVAIAAVAAA